jgi:GntR family transcriptional regulator / MocR family aminotransferase
LEKAGTGTRAILMKRARLVDFPLPDDLGRYGRPLWRALASAVAWQIDIGRVRPGERVPSVRTIARHLAVSRNTVVLAFDWLIADGYLASRVGDGTYVLDRSHRTQLPLWQQRRRWIRDPDGLLVSVTTGRRTWQ